MKLLGSTTVRGFYPVETREEAVLVVRKGIFLYTNGIVGSAIYLYKTEERAFERREWVVECVAHLKNAAEVSVESGEFDELFRYGALTSGNPAYNYNEWQRHVVLWSGYDGLVFDCGFTAVYGSLSALQAVKAYPRIKDETKDPEYNTVWAKIKRLSGLFKRETSHG